MICSSCHEITYRTIGSTILGSGLDVMVSHHGITSLEGPTDDVIVRQTTFNTIKSLFMLYMISSNLYEAAMSLEPELLLHPMTSL